MKQTEIGLIPDDWEVKMLGTITTHVDYRGKTPKKTNIGIQLITAKNIRMGYIDYKNNQEYISPKDYFEVMKRGLPKKGDVLITTEAPAGNVAQIDNENVALAQRVIKYRGNDILNNNYLCYYFLSDAFQNLLHSLNTGGTVQGIKGSLLHTLPVIVPPLAEQKRIAKALSDVDALISTTEKLVQKKKNIKQGTMQNLLTGKKRLPAFAKSTCYKQSELGLIPEDWEVKKLGEICVINPTSSNIIPDEFFYIDLESVSSGKLEKKQKISKRNAPSRAQRQFEKDDILYQTVRPYQRNNLFVNFDSKNYIASTDYAIIRLDNFVNIVLDNCTGTSYPAINPKFLKTIPVIIPSKEEQTAIANVLSSMDKEIESLNAKLEKYRNLKTAMMQQLLTGKIRL